MPEERGKARSQRQRGSSALREALEGALVVYECPTCSDIDKVRQGDPVPRCECRGRSWPMLAIGYLIDPSLDLEAALKGLAPSTKKQAQPEPEGKEEHKPLTRDDITDLCPDEELLFLSEDEFDAALIGVANRFSMPSVAAYDYWKVIEVLVARGMTQEEAEEFFDFNIIGAWMGDRTPVFVDVM